MWRSLMLALACACLAGCATVRDDASPPWRDTAFAYQPALVTVTREDLFRLDADLLAQVLQPMPADLSPSHGTTPSPPGFRTGSRR